jgi:hypothetical protein
MIRLRVNQIQVQTVRLRRDEQTGETELVITDPSGLGEFSVDDRFLLEVLDLAIPAQLNRLRQKYWLRS